jgi:hypothetical protein
LFRMLPGAVDRFLYRSLVRMLPPVRGLTVLNEQEPRQKVPRHSSKKKPPRDVR